MKKEIRIAFVDFWKSFDYHESTIVNILNQLYDLKIVDAVDADYIFFSNSGYEHLFQSDDKILIYFTGEDICPNFNECDYAIGFEYMSYGDRYLRFPLYCIERYKNDIILAEKKHLVAYEQHKTFFCSFTVSNGNGNPIREQLFEKLSEYKKIDSGGSWKNNIGHNVKDKFEFDSKHKFSLVCENSSHPGYTTEKIIQAFAAVTVPIYWGDPLITDEFNRNSFICVTDFNSMDALVDYVKEVDGNEYLYNQYLREPIYTNESIDYESFINNLSLFLRHIIDQPLSLAKRRNRDFWGEIVLSRYRNLLIEKKHYRELLILQSSIKYHLKQIIKQMIP